MAKEIEVLFTETKKGQFNIGDQKKVKLGYARNYLLPQKLAVIVSNDQLSLLESIKKKAEKQREALEESAVSVKDNINDQTVIFEMKAHDEGKLYGSVSSADVASQLNRNFETELDKTDVIMEPIKELGSFKVKIDIHPNVEIQVNVKISLDKD
jgi:large subunit ribosomal protein L9